jgi:amino acid permease
MALTFQAALLNGGPISLSYGVILAAFGVIAIALSLAEMASMFVDVKRSFVQSSDHMLAILQLELSIAGLLAIAQGG